MGRISRPVIQHHLGVTGQFDSPGLIAQVTQRDPAQFEIGIRGDADFNKGFNTVLLLAKLGNTAIKPAFLIFRRCLTE